MREKGANEPARLCLVLKVAIYMKLMSLNEHKKKEIEEKSKRKVDREQKKKEKEEAAKKKALLYIELCHVD